MKRFLILSICLFSINLSYAQILNGDLTGSFESKNIYYFSDNPINAQQPDNIIGSNNYLKLDYRKGNFSAGVQYEAYLAPIVGFDPLLEGNDFVFKYIQFTNNYLNITVGNFYEQFGSGLIFRSYEERAIGLNTAMDGVKILFSPIEYLRIKAIWGKQREYLDNGDGTVRGLDGEISLLPLLGNNESFSSILLGASWINRYQKYTGIVEDYPTSIESYAARLQVDLGIFSLYSEFVEKDKEPTLGNQNSNEIGNALLISPSLVGKNVGLNINFRCIKNMEFRSEREAINQILLLNYIPALTRQHKYALAMIHPYGAQSIGEIGGQIDLFYNLKKGSFLGGKYGTKVSTNFSYYKNLESKNAEYQKFLSFGEKKLFQDFNIEIEKKLSKKVKTVFSYFNIEYNKEAIVSDGDELLKSHVAVLDLQYKFNPKSSIRTELQHLWTKQDDKNWIFGLVEYSLAPKWSIFVSEMYNYGVTNKHYMNAGISYSKKVTRLMISGGRHKEGLECVGGVCNRVKAYTGIFVSLSTSF
jgi:hypothetical protein